MHEYIEVIRALGDGEKIQVVNSSKTGDYRDLSFKEVLIYVADELYEPRHFRVKPSVIANSERNENGKSSI